MLRRSKRGGTTRDGRSGWPADAALPSTRRGQTVGQLQRTVMRPNIGERWRSRDHPAARFWKEELRLLVKTGEHRRKDRCRGEKFRPALVGCWGASCLDDARVPVQPRDLDPG